MVFWKLAKLSDNESDSSSQPQTSWPRGQDECDTVHPPLLKEVRDG